MSIGQFQTPGYSKLFNTKNPVTLPDQGWNIRSRSLQTRSQPLNQRASNLFFNNYPTYLYTKEHDLIFYTILLVIKQNESVIFTYMLLNST